MHNMDLHKFVASYEYNFRESIWKAVNFLLVNRSHSIHINHADKNWDNETSTENDVKVMLWFFHGTLVQASYNHILLLSFAL